MLILAMLLASPAAQAFCGTYVGQASSTLYNESSEVVLARDGNRTTITMANDYQGDASEFAVVVPVPVILNPEDVRIPDGTAIAAADQYSGPRLVSYTCDSLHQQWAMGGASSGCFGCSDVYYAMDASGSADTGLEVTVENQFTAGDYEIVILSAEDAGDLVTWLNLNGYAVHQATETLLEEYIEQGVYFFAAKVSMDMLDEERRFLQPIQFSYEAELLSLPVRLGTLNSPGVQDLLIYVINSEAEGRVSISNYPEATPETECMYQPTEEEPDYGTFYNNLFEEAYVEAGGGAAWATEYSWSPSGCDPCSSDPPTEEQLAELGWDKGPWDAHFTRLHVRYTPQSVDQDLVFYSSGMTDTMQIRHITHKDELESDFPICRTGWVEDDPGSCFDDDPIDELNGRPGDATPWNPGRTRAQRRKTAGAFGAFLLILGLRRRRWDG